ncbi:hypothetical protein DID88_010379 [Monilinia fructigena]|uniref:Uncharacterized protein n=1 Tax=Monilinia fructigena TaxID=38457 RepID=A0A395II74_9HELO|nr:hypothetical protein DID88_010379 [Monilinia fructigena]
MACQYDKDTNCYSADYSSPVPHYEAVDRTQNTSFLSRSHAYMKQTSPFSETFFQVNNFKVEHEVEEKQLSSSSLYPDKFYIPSAPWHFNQLQTVPSVSSPFNDDLYNQSSAYSLGEEKSGGGGPVFTAYLNSTMSQEGSYCRDISHRTLSAPHTQDRFSPNSPSYATAGLEKTGSNSGLETYYAYQTSTPQTSAFSPSILKF